MKKRIEKIREQFKVDSALLMQEKQLLLSSMQAKKDAVNAKFSAAKKQLENREKNTKLPINKYIYR